MNLDNVLLQAAITFCAMFALDFVWVFYTKAVTARRVYPAGGWAAGITVLNAIAAIIYVGDPWMIIPAGVGAFAGTLLAMRRDRAAPQA